ncbi:AAA family ATPase [Photobacterium damselae subsp. damselae]|uniref:ATP-dependent nuclease n=1 Tax=Photobacterium damselae TaxID=38293 RepID=UPI001F3D39F5|nr:AAA family ATPase [Photobacterium damselae]UKA06060.1 AAA family ATPase [Photobacterium damselae subsp. damselae]UKA21164.1 AAA family ATPase [Photobacterium damselae subsp. damselae]
MMTDFLTKATTLPIHAFDNYILDIRFPFFKKIKTNSKIVFSCPFTVLVGPNGSGKSSTLQAMYGAPKGQSVGDFWFSTALDPILESGDDINRFIYRYKVRGISEDIEILKTRARRKARADRPENPDYWETAKPNVKDNMANVPQYKNQYRNVMTSAGRWRPVEKNVVYIDFRAELSAFDKFFYFGKFTRTKKIHKKQDFLRKFSKILSEHLKKSKSAFPIKWGIKKRSQSLYTLTNEEIKWVNQILGKSYIEATIIKHNLFNNDGYSIIFKEQNQSYSEAVAGSGEVSVVNCVTQALQADEYSLILLDEPEVSLHPGAQKELRNLLCHVIVKNKCQVVMSTHSEHFVHGLPNNAIKLFQYDNASNTYSILNECSPEQAFIRLGSTLGNTSKKRIYVEDELAKGLLIEAIMEIDKESIDSFEVIPYPGGANTMLNNLLVHFAAAETDTNDIVLLDGDMLKSVHKAHIELYKKELASGKIAVKLYSQDIPESSYCNLDDILQSQTGMKGSSFQLPLNGGNSANDEQKIKFKLKILDCYHEKFNFMNVDTPEEFIWEMAKSEQHDFINIESMKLTYTTPSYKTKFKEVTEFIYSGQSDKQKIFAIQMMFLHKRDKEHPDWIRFKKLIQNVLSLQPIES